MNLCVTTKYLRPNLFASFLRFASASPEVVDQSEVLVDDSDEARAKEAELGLKRNISRLSPAHRNIINGRQPYEKPKIIAHLTVKYNRKLYGKYGSASGVNPSLCFPTKADITEKLEYEDIAHPHSIQEMIAIAAEKRRAEQEKIEKRDQDIAAKYAKLAQWKKEINDKIAKKSADANAAKERKERLVEEVRRHFGFTLDPRDERFQEMLAKREKEQKKQEKMARKEAKEMQMMSKLQKNAEQPKSK